MRSARPAGSYDNESHLNKRQLQKRSSNAREGERPKVGERERERGRDGRREHSAEGDRR